MADAVGAGWARAGGLAGSGRVVWRGFHARLPLLVRHVAVDLLDHGPLPERFGALLVSGGHTSLLVVDNITSATTEMCAAIDDAAGEAFDEVTRLRGMGLLGCRLSA